MRNAQSTFFKRGNDFSTFLSKREILNLTEDKSEVATFNLSEDDFSNVIFAELRKREKIAGIFYWVAAIISVVFLFMSIFNFKGYVTDGTKKS